MRIVRIIAGLAVYLCLCGFGGDVGSGSGDGSGGSPNSFGLANRSVSVKDYGGMVNGLLLHDAAFTAAAPVADGSSTSPQAPAVTAVIPNSWVVTVIGYNSGTLTPPATPTQRVLVATGAQYGVYEGDQVVASPGTVAAQTGTQGSADWTAGSFTLAPYPAAATISSGTGSGYTTHAACTNGSNCNLAVPSNAAAGDLLMACDIIYSTYLPAGTAVTGFNLISYSENSSHQSMYCFGRKMVAGDTTFQFASNVTSGQSTFMVDFKNAIVYGSTMSSASATFASTDIGKNYCLQSSSIGGGEQTCGIIPNVIDSHDIALSFYPVVTATGKEFGYGTDDTAAWNSAMSALMPTGGTITTPGMSVATSDIILPTAVTVSGVSTGYGWIFQGTASATPSLFLVGTAYSLNPTSGLMFLTTSGVATGGIVAVSPNTKIVVRDMTIMGGVGWYKDGGGASADGVNLPALYTHAKLENVVITNFSHDCADAPSTNQPWSGISIDQSILMSCANWCDDMAGLGSQGISLTDSMFQECGEQSVGGGGIFVNGQGVSITGNTVQDQATGQPDFAFGAGETGVGTPSSGEITSNYSEGVSTWFTLSANMVGFKWENNVYAVGGSPLQEIFSEATTQLPSPAKYGYYAPVCVSDALACTIGATYTPAANAGTAHCSVQSNKTDWLIVGGCP